MSKKEWKPGSVVMDPVAFDKVKKGQVVFSGTFMDKKDEPCPFCHKSGGYGCFHCSPTKTPRGLR